MPRIRTSREKYIYDSFLSACSCDVSPAGNHTETRQKPQTRHTGCTQHNNTAGTTCCVLTFRAPSFVTHFCTKIFKSFKANKSLCVVSCFPFSFGIPPPPRPCSSRNLKHQQHLSNNAGSSTTRYYYYPHYYVWCVPVEESRVNFPGTEGGITSSSIHTSLLLSPTSTRALILTIIHLTI